MLVAGPLLAATLTRDPVLVAGAAFAQRLPWLLFPLFAGALVDRLDRRRVMGYVDATRCLLIAALGFAVAFDAATLPVLYAVFFFLGTLETLFDNAAQAILPSVVPRRNLEKANGRLYAAEIVANNFVGPPLGGFLFTVFAAAPFLLDAGSFAAAAALILALRGSFKPLRPEDAPPTTLVADIREGLAWLYGHRLLLTLALMLCVMNMMFGATEAILVLFAQERLGLGATGFGVLLTAGAVGGIFGSLIAEKVTDVLGAGRTLLACVALSAAPLVVQALTTNAYVFGAMISIFGAAAVTWNVITVSLRQSIAPEAIFGRVNSAYRLLGWGGISVGALLGGFLARGFGLTAPFWVAAAVLGAMFFMTLPLITNEKLEEARNAA